MDNRRRTSRRKWLPIATAPLDGTALMLWFEYGGWGIGAWDGDYWSDLNTYEDIGEPKYWMLLPSPPMEYREDWSA